MSDTRPLVQPLQASQTVRMLCHGWSNESGGRGWTERSEGNPGVSSYRSPTPATHQCTSDSVLGRLWDCGQRACRGVLILTLLTSVANAQLTEQPLFGVTIRNTTLEQRFVQTRTESDSVTKVILGSDVQGEQSTTTETRLRILPDADNIRFDVVNTGDVTSQTTSINREVLIDGVGNHHFEITKPFWFDGSGFLTQPGYGTIQAKQCPRRVVSAMGAALPLLSPLSDRIAWEQVSRRQGQIDQAVAEDLSCDVLPKINRIIDEEFARLERQLANMRTQAAAGLRDTPLRWVASSTDTTFSIAAISQQHGMAPTSLNAATVAMPQLNAGEEVAFMMSESVATALLENYVPGGLMLTDTQVEKAAKAWNSNGDDKWSVASLLQLVRDLETHSTSTPVAFSIEMAKERPMAVRFDRGDICIETAFQIVPKLGAPSGGMKMSWRMRGRGVSADEWAIALDRIDIGDGENPISIARGATTQPESQPPELRIPVEGELAHGEVNVSPPEVVTVETGTPWISVVTHAAQSLVEQIPPATLPREFNLPITPTGSSRARLMRVESADGVLRAAFRLVNDP